MKIQLLSDLHLEAHPDFRPCPAPGAEVLVLAGDIGSYQSGSLLTERGDADFGLARFSPWNGWPVPVIFVPGNHEYDALDFDEAHARLQETCERLGLIWLEREQVTLTGADGVPVRFIGTTLWSDFDALGPTSGPTGTGSSSGPDGTSRKPRPVGTGGGIAQSIQADSLQTLLLRAREKAFRAANFYLRKTGGTRAGALFLAEAIREQALACQQWLRATLAQPFDGPTVVITHFAPSLRSADPRYGLTPGTAGFCNALDDLLTLAPLWLHGHLHAPSDYRHNGCRVVANPLGYARKGEQTAFDAEKVIDAASTG